MLNKTQSIWPKEIVFGSGSVEYLTYYDSVWLGGLEVKNQGFGGVIEEQDIFEGAAFDGLMGIGYPELDPSAEFSPIFDTIINNKLLEHNVFGLFISRNGYGSSRFWLGGANKNYIKDQNINYHKVVLKRWWTLRLDKVLVNGIDTKLCSTQPSNANQKCGIIMDSGTSTMAVPSNSFSAFKDIIHQTAKENDIKSWPTVTFVIDGKNYALDGHEIVSVNGLVTYQKEAKKDDVIKLTWEDFGNTSAAYNIWIAGDAFLSKFITTYDRDTDQVGIAQPDFEKIKQIQDNEVGVNYKLK